MFSQGSIREKLSKFFKLDSLADNLLGYVEARVELLKMEVREDVAKGITRALVFGVILLLAFLFIIFLSVAIALLLNEQFESSYVGFLAVAGFYLLLFLVSLIFRKPAFSYLERFFKERLKQKH